MVACVSSGGGAVDYSEINSSAEFLADRAETTIPGGGLNRPNAPCATSDSTLLIDLLGPFRLREENREICVNSRKGQALVAMLAMSRFGERTRPWLIDHLWGSRWNEQGRASLRQQLSQLRRTDKALSSVLYSHGDRIGMDLKRCIVDARSPSLVTHCKYQFLEGLDIPGEDRFEDWLRRTRQCLPHPE